MIIFIALISVSFLMAAYWHYYPPREKNLTIIVTRVHLVSLALTIILIVLMFGGFKFAGRYTNSILSATFLTTGIFLFGLTKTKAGKIYSGLIAIPILIGGVGIITGFGALAIPGFISYLLFAPPTEKVRIDDTYSLEVHRGGLMAPPNLFYLERSSGFILDKQISLTNPEVYSEIKKIQIVGFKENEYVVCKIYSNENITGYTLDTLHYTTTLSK